MFHLFFNLIRNGLLKGHVLLITQCQLELKQEAHMHKAKNNRLESMREFRPK